MAFLKRNRKKETYREVHNLTVSRYRQFSRVLIWAGIFNFVGPIIGIVQFANGYGTRFQFEYCFGACDFLFNWFFNWFYPSDSLHFLLYFLVFLVAGAISALSILVSVFASQGKKKWLKAGVIGYMLDWLFLPIVYLFSGMDASEAQSNVWISAGIHAIVTFCLFMAVYEYRKVIDTEKRFAKTTDASPEKEESKQ